MWKGLARFGLRWSGFLRVVDLWEDLLEKFQDLSGLPLRDLT